jgi:hypothetical protein
MEASNSLPRSTAHAHTSTREEEGENTEIIGKRKRNHVEPLRSKNVAVLTHFYLRHQRV